MAWKPSYGDVEVAGFFVYILFGTVRSHSVLSVTRRIIGRWKGLGERNPTVSREKGSDQYLWRTCEVSLPPLVFTWIWVFIMWDCLYLYWSGWRGLFYAREVKGIWISDLFFIYLFCYKYVKKFPPQNQNSSFSIKTLLSFSLSRL